MEKNEINIQQLQNKMLEIFLYFKKICDENNLKFYICGGGLIGAVRHKGFIPWDDDIDVFMPREDYEKLGEIWEKYADTTKYRYCRTNLIENYHDCGASIRDLNTTFINRHSKNEDICHGLAIEIMPIDGCPKSKILRGWQLLNAMIFALFNAQRLPDNKGKLFRIVAKIVYTLIPSKKLRYYIWKFTEKQMTRYSWDNCEEVTELIGSLKGMLLRHPKEDFDQIVYLDFEGYKIPAMKGYENYLKKIWGNYMELPPIEKRVAKHDAVYIDLNNSYKKYKGIYYLVQNIGGEHDE